MRKPKPKRKIEEFGFLLEESGQLGALEAKVIRLNQVLVQDRVVLKCKAGCHMYGHKLVCPPFTPTPHEVKMMLKEYRALLVVKFPSDAEAEDDVKRNLLKNQCALGTPPDLRDRTKKFWDAWGGDKRRIFLAMLELEKAAFKRGYTLAFVLTAGACAPCEKCNMGGTCTHPTMARSSEHGLGVIVKKTDNNVGMADVYEWEPHLHPGLIKLDNVVLLPHMGGAEIDTRKQMANENLPDPFSHS